MEGLNLNARAIPLDPPDPAWQVVGLRDFDGYGQADALWRETGSSLTYLWQMDGPSLAGAGFTTAQADDTWTIQ